MGLGRGPLQQHSRDEPSRCGTAQEVRARQPAVLTHPAPSPRRPGGFSGMFNIGKNLKQLFLLFLAVMAFYAIVL